MKLCTRILWISGLAVVLVAVICNGLVWKWNEESLYSEARSVLFRETVQVLAAFDQEMSKIGSEHVADEMIVYALRQCGSDYDVCVRQVAETLEPMDMIYQTIYNHTVFDGKTLMELSYTDDKASGLSYAEISWSGRRVLVTKNYYGLDRDIYIFHLMDITVVQATLQELLREMCVITCCAVAVVWGLLYVLLQRSFQPLQKLNEMSQAMAQGHYEERLPAMSQDEVGQLGASFNKMADAVEERTQSLEASSQRMKLFMGDLTHELRTPLTVISGYAQTLQAVKVSPEEEAEALTYIKEECERLGRLSRKMIRLLELEEGELELVDTPVRSVFIIAICNCQVLAAEKNVALEWQEHGERCTMDADLMIDALMNLLDNAIKASEPGGRVLLFTEEKRIVVQDFGAGIPVEEQEKILEPFYMIDKSRSRQAGGAGLGLALTTTILKRHGMTLEIASAPGQGTRMKIVWS